MAGSVGVARILRRCHGGGLLKRPAPNYGCAEHGLRLLACLDWGLLAAVRALASIADDAL